MTGPLAPDFFYTSLAAIDLEALKKRGVRGLLVDLDNTLLPRNTHVLPPSAHEFAANVRASGLSACLVSNNWQARVLGIAHELGFELVPRALKPLPFAFSRGLKLLGITRDQAAVVGDQLFTDVLGGNAMGLTTVLVVPLSSTDLPHTLLLRKVESRVMRGRTPLA